MSLQGDYKGIREGKKEEGEGKDTDKLDDEEDRERRWGDEEGEEGDVVIGDPALGLQSTLH